jgi:hypothetical protein
VRQYTATGSIVFLDGATAIGTVKLDATGTANLAISTLAAGTHNLSATYAGDSVLTSTTGGPITVTVADYTLQSQPTTLNLTAGQTGTATISVIPLGGSTQTVSFSCGAVPAKLTCAFAPATVTLDGVTAASVKITVTAAAATASNIAQPNLWGVVSTVAFAGLLLPFGRRKRLKRLFGLVAVLAFAFCIAGCGSSNSTPPVAQATTATYVVNITATAGSSAKSVPLVVTVNN